MRPFVADPADQACATGLASQGGWFDGPPEIGTGGLLAAGVLDALLTEAAASTAPFALLDDQLTGRATLFTRPIRTICAQTAAEFPGALGAVRDAVDKGAFLVGFMSYAAGECLDVVRTPPRPWGKAGEPPLLWFSEFADRHEGLLGDWDGPRTGAEVRPAIRRADYEARVAAAIGRIRAGDIYQVNLTFPAEVDIADPLTFYRDVRRRARAPFGAFVQIPGRTLLSFSPELFFRTEAERIWARPMKGTRPRGATPAADERQAAALRRSAKDRAENLMIVDLLRNDLSRVCRAGSVEVPRLFELEPYPTVWQMTSTVRGSLRADKDVVDALAALFPCGSITGAPKIMAMRVIGDLETVNRGVYTGGIGMLSARKSAFSVAIRTVDVADGVGRLDVGAGIVADSKPRAEWLECLAKARFLSPPVFPAVGRR